MRSFLCCCLCTKIPSNLTLGYIDAKSNETLTVIFTATNCELKCETTTCSTGFKK